jgi:GTP cyclohydrolase I
MTNPGLKCNGNEPKTREQKDKMIEEAAIHYGNFMTALGFDWKSDLNAQDTPRRVAKSFVNDLFAGCYSEAPVIKTFPNNDPESGLYDGVVFQGRIEINSMCAHHHLPFVGEAYVAYIPGDDKESEVLGLSKLNRIVEFFARRPQIQESLTTQIHKYLDKIAKDNRGIAVMIKAEHQCACLRGVKHDSAMCTAKLSGFFKDDVAARNEFYTFVNQVQKR